MLLVFFLAFTFWITSPLYSPRGTTAKVYGRLDASGAIVSGTETKRPRLAWDAPGRLRKVEEVTPAGGTRVVAEYSYDHAGRRVWKSGTGLDPTGQPVTDVRRYVYDGEALLAELKTSPGGGFNTVRRYLHGIGVLARESLEDDADVPTRRPDAEGVPTRRPDADSVRTRRPDAGPPDRRYSAATRSRNDTPGSRRPVGTLGRPVGTLGRPVRTPEAPGAGPGSNSPFALQTLFHHTDGLGSTVNVTRSDGSVSNAYRYDAWGKARELEAGGACLTAPDLGFDGLVDWNAYLGNLASAFAEDDNRITFTGYEVDPETGLYNAGARVYDPEAGRKVRTRRPGADRAGERFGNRVISGRATPGSGRPVRTGAPVSLHRYLYANANPLRFVDPTGNASEDTAGGVSLTNRSLGEGPGMDAGGEASGGAPAEGLTAEEMAAMAHDVRLSKDNWPLSVSRAAPQYQGTWPPHVGAALEEWVRRIPPDRVDPMTRLTRVADRGLKWIADEWEEFKSDPLRYPFHSAARVAWYTVFVPVGETCIAGYEMVTDPSWEHAEKFGRNLFNLAPSVGMVSAGVQFGERTLTKLGEMGGKLWFKGKAPELPLARSAGKTAGKDAGEAAERGLAHKASASEHPPANPVVKEAVEEPPKPPECRNWVNAEGRTMPGCFAAGTLVWTDRGPVAIEDVRVGDRVLTDGEEGPSEGEPEPEAARVVRLWMPDPEGTAEGVTLELLCSAAWALDAGAAPGARVPVELGELRLSGTAEVMSVRAARPSVPGAGRRVLMTVERPNNNLWEVRFEGTREVLRLTGTHRLYAVDRQDWAAASGLMPGERLAAFGGTWTVASVRRLPGRHRVYNLEVDTDHVYLVSPLAILSHNVDGCGRPPGEAGASNKGQIQTYGPGSPRSPLGADIQYADPAPTVYRNGLTPDTPVVDHIRARALRGHPTDPENLHVKAWSENARKGWHEGEYLREKVRLISEGLTPDQAEWVLEDYLRWIMTDIHATPVDPILLDRLPSP